MSARSPGGGVPRTVKGLSVVSLFNDLASEMVYPLLPALMTGPLGGGALALGLLDGAAELTSAALKVVSGRLADRPGWRGPLILVGYATAVLVRPLIAVAGAAWQVVGFRVIDRVGKGLRTPPRDALIAAVTPPDLARPGVRVPSRRGPLRRGARVGGGVAAPGAGARRARRDRLERGAGPAGVCLVLVPLLRRQRPSEPARRDEHGPPVDATGRVFWAPVLAPCRALPSSACPRRCCCCGLQDLGVLVALIPLVWAGLHVVRSATPIPVAGSPIAWAPRIAVASGGVLFAVGRAAAGRPAVAGRGGGRVPRAGGGRGAHGRRGARPGGAARAGANRPRVRSLPRADRRRGAAGRPRRSAPCIRSSGGRRALLASGGGHGPRRAAYGWSSPAENRRRANDESVGGTRAPGVARRWARDAEAQVLIRVGEPGRATYSELHEGLRAGTPCRRLRSARPAREAARRALAADSRPRSRGRAPWNDAPLALTRLAELRDSRLCRQRGADDRQDRGRRGRGAAGAGSRGPARAAPRGPAGAGARRARRCGGAEGVPRPDSQPAYGVGDAWVLGRLGRAASDSLQARFLAAEDVELEGPVSDAAHLLGRHQRDPAARPGLRGAGQLRRAAALRLARLGRAALDRHPSESSRRCSTRGSRLAARGSYADPRCRAAGTTSWRTTARR